MKFKKLFSALALASMVLPLASCAVKVETISANVPDTVYLGETKVLTVDIQPAEADIKDYTFVSSDASILSVNGNVIEGLALGDVELTLTSADKSIKPVVYDVKVAHKMPIGFTANIPTVMEIGKEIELSVAFTPTDATFKEYSVAVEDSAIISYDAETNKIKALEAGNTNIKITCGELVNTYPVEVRHIVPTKITTNIPSKMTTVDTIVLDVKYEPENATLTKYEVTISNPDVLAYNPIEKTITAKSVGESNVTLNVKGTNISATQHVEVVKGYSVPKTDAAYKDFAKEVLPMASKNATQIKIDSKSTNAWSKAVTEQKIEIRRTENAFSTNVASIEGNETVNFKNLVQLKNNQLISVDTNPNEQSFMIQNIVDESVEENEISKADALLALQFNVFDRILDQIDDYVDTTDNNATIDTDTGKFVITYTTTVDNYGDKTTTETSISSTKEGVVESVTYKQSILKQSETEEIVLFNDSFTLVYGKKYDEQDLFINDLTPYVATSFDATYSQGLNVEVGAKFYDSYIKISNIQPATALNMDAIEYEIIDNDNILNDDYRPKFIKAGTITVNVSPIYYIGEKITKSFTITASIPEAEAFEYVKLDTTDTEYKVGSTYALDAKITPNGAEQSYVVTSSDAEKATVSQENGKWSVKLLKAGEVTLTFKASSNEMIQKTLKITIVDDKPAAAPAYVGTYKFTIGFFDYELTLNENDGKIYNLTSKKDEATVTVLDVYGKSTLFIDLQFNVTGSIDIKSTKSTSKFHPDTNVLDFIYITKNSMTKTINITKELPVELPPYVGTYKFTIRYFDYQLTLNENDGKINRLPDNRDEANFTITSIAGKSKLFIDINIEIVGSIDIKPGKCTLKFELSTNKLEFEYNTNSGIKQVITMTKDN